MPVKAAPSGDRVKLTVAVALLLVTLGVLMWRFWPEEAPPAGPGVAPGPASAGNAALPEPPPNSPRAHPAPNMPPPEPR